LSKINTSPKAWCTKRIQICIEEWHIHCFHCRWSLWNKNEVTKKKSMPKGRAKNLVPILGKLILVMECSQQFRISTKGNALAHQAQDE
jgi:hypothetical protein